VVGGAANGIPIASWPIGNPTTYSLDQLLTWYVEGASLGITGYTIEYCVDPDTFGDVGCTTSSGITTTQYEITGLSYGDIVTWRVKASYSSGSDSDWTDSDSQGSFTVTGGLTTLSAVLTYPVGGLLVTATELQFNWYLNGATLPTGTITYEVQWSYTETFSPIGTVTKSATTTKTYYDVTSLIPGHTYWWRVRISLDGGSTYGSYSTVATFDVVPGTSAVMPRVGSPTRSVTVATASPTLSWILPTHSASTLSYELHVGAQPNLSDATVYENITKPFFRLTDLAIGRHYWAVRSHSTDGTSSALSSVGSFVAVGSISTGVETLDDSGDNRPGDATAGDEQQVEDPTEQIIPTDYDLGQNYPNPFNPTTTIEFSVPHASRVAVRIYNVLGQVVRTLVNRHVEPGVHRVVWDSRDDAGSELSSGLYIYRIEAADYSQAKTLVLLK